VPALQQAAVDAHGDTSAGVPDADAGRCRPARSIRPAALTSRSTSIAVPGWVVAVGIGDGPAGRPQTSRRGGAVETCAAASPHSLYADYRRVGLDNPIRVARMSTLGQRQPIGVDR
jgi:hypothetical protein